MLNPPAPVAAVLTGSTTADQRTSSERFSPIGETATATAGPPVPVEQGGVIPLGYRSEGAGRDLGEGANPAKRGPVAGPGLRLVAGKVPALPEELVEELGRLLGEALVLAYEQDTAGLVSTRPGFNYRGGDKP